MRILVVFYSVYGHIYKMAEAVAEGAHPCWIALLFRVREILVKIGAIEPQKKFEHIPVCKVAELGQADGIIFGTPTRFGNMCGQMRQFLDATGGLWAKRALVGKVGSVFTSSGTQHGGQETTIISTMLTLLHHGMIIAGLPYSFEGQRRMDEITGCSPYGASTLAGADDDRDPTENELAGARYQGRYVAGIVARLGRGDQGVA